MIQSVLAQNVGTIEILVVLLYLGATFYLGWLGYRHTRSASDYLLAGRQAHPFIMAMSYGATFISTSAIVGFGGVAAMFGMSLLWLVFLNIFVGIFIAFIILGGRTRRLGQELNAHTFPELLGRRYKSKGIQIFTGMVIFVFMPLYAAAVLIGAAKFVTAEFGMDYNTALLIFTILMGLYVVAGGLKGVMYTDALQGTIMTVVMIILLVYTYVRVGGVSEGHQALAQLTDLVPPKLKAMGHQGWAATPLFGFGNSKYDLWWIVFSTITLGVGIGVLAQPQLVVRFMTVRSQRELNRAVGIGGLFILLIPGTAYVTGALSNVYFARSGSLLEGRVTQVIDPEKGHALVEPMIRDAAGTWVAASDKDGKPKPAIPVVLDEASRGADLGAKPIVRGRSISIVYAGEVDEIIPTFITKAMPKWFGMLFALTLLAAAMSTLSGQFHTLGTAMSRDVIEQVYSRKFDSVRAARISIVVGIILAYFVAKHAGGGYIIARATAIFFGLCSATFMPAYVGGLFFKRVNKAGAIASMAVGFSITAFWLLFVKAQEAGSIGLVRLITGGKPSILADHPNWSVVDPVVIALPVSILAAILFSLIFRSKEMPAAPSRMQAGEPAARELESVR